ncbi:PAS domain S-box protein [Belliella sp. R4-6]|uniref:histidine kinase n=1 Tax=Belliella alkalica TaxID=1730871 RepID=A0ABS9V7B6_9BACT|nr:PAS domain S-box protein [Belliella alkalica]MCH7412035.1 PAS domain S-box protein [Belliella alkalica]
MVNSEAILKAIGKSYFILQSKDKIKEAIPSILSLLGNATQVDRVYIFQNYKGENDELHFSQKFEWVAEGVVPQIDFEELQNVPWSVFPIVAEKLSKNQVINEVLNEETNGKDFYDTMSEQGILSFLFIPIMVENKFWGFIGFDNCSTKNIYSDEQAAALHAFTSTLGYTILSKKQKKRLLKAKESYSFLINNVSEVIFKLDKESKWIFINKQWKNITSRTVSSTLGNAFKSAFAEEYRETICGLMNQLTIGTIEKLTFESELLMSEGGSKWVKVQVSPQFDFSNEIVAFTGSIIDINREKEVLAKLEESVEQTNAVINSVKDTLYTFSGDLKKVLFVSKNIEVLCIDREKYIQTENYWYEIIHHEDRDFVKNEVDKLFKCGVFDAVYRIVNDQGKVLWIQDKAWAVRDNKSKIIKIHGRYTDITELKTKELKLKSSEDSLRKLNDLLQAVNDTQLSFYLEKDFQTPLYTLLTKILEITGSKFGFIGEILFDENNYPYLKTHSITNIAWSDESEKFFRDNYQSGLEFRNLNTLFGRSICSGELLISNDVENDLRATGTPEGHPTIKKFMGVPVYKGDEFLGLMGFANKDSDYTESDVEILQPLISGYANLIKSIRIHKQKQEAERLRIESDEMYRLLSENTGDIIALHALDLKFEYISPSIHKVLGYTPEECVGKAPEEVFGLSSINTPNLKIVNNFSTVINHQHKITGKVVALETIITPLTDDNGMVYSYMATSRDVTEREAVLTELKESLSREQELNQLKSRFISMTSHEFRTPLATIMSSTEILEILLSDLKEDHLESKTKVHLERINNQIQRLTRVIADLLVLEKNAQDKIVISKEQVSINHFLRNTVDHYFPDSIKKIKLNLPNEDRIINLDPSILSHVINNLIDNAIKYSFNASRNPEISLNLSEKTYQIIVKDYGLGIPIDDQKYIFGSFFRAKNVNTIKGTGLGLNIVKEFIEKLGGDIHFESVENEGAKFIITLPYEH